MVATGIVRRVDELGRIVIPKELRNTLNIKEGERLEIFTSDLGVVLKKHSIFSEHRPDLKGIVRILSAYINKGLAISDTQYILACKKELAHLSRRKLDDKYIEFIKNKESSYTKSGQKSKIDGKTLINEEEYILPIVVDGDVVGSIIIRADKISEVEIALVSFASKIITYRL